MLEPPIGDGVGVQAKPRVAHGGLGEAEHGPGLGVGPVGFQNSVTATDLRFQAARSYSLIYEYETAA